MKNSSMKSDDIGAIEKIFNQQNVLTEELLFVRRNDNILTQDLKNK